MPDKIEWLCPHCDKVYNTALEAKNCNCQSKPRVTPADQVKPPVRPPIKDEPIKLKYVYEGRCKDCRTPIETIFINDPSTKTKQIVIAYCNSCHKQWQQTKVKKL